MTEGKQKEEEKKKTVEQKWSESKKKIKSRCCFTLLKTGCFSRMIRHTLWSGVTYQKQVTNAALVRRDWCLLFKTTSR